MKFLKYFYLATAVILLVVILQNLEPSGLNVLAWKYEMPKGVLWFLLILLGAVLSELRHLFSKPNKAMNGKEHDLDISV